MDDKDVNMKDNWLETLAKNFCLYNVLVKAEIIARKAHRGQFRHDKKTPFIEHPKAVATVVDTNEKKIIAWLHDVVEDTDISYVELVKEGIPSGLVYVVSLLTRGETEDYLAYLLKLKHNPLATDIKLADMRHNRSTSKSKYQKEKYDLGIFILEHNWEKK